MEKRKMNLCWDCDFDVNNGGEYIVDEGEMKKRIIEQACIYCGKLLNAYEPDAYVYCDVCGKDGKNRKREYQER